MSTQTKIPEHIVILYCLVREIDLQRRAKRLFDKSVDTGWERSAEAGLIKADRRYARALRAARNYLAEEGF